MTRKASDRKKVRMSEVTLNLNPMMDMFAVLIPALLMMSAVVEVTILNVAMPSIGGGDGDGPSEEPKEALNLTLTITDKGYTVAGAGGVLGGTQQAAGPTIPVIQRTVACTRYRNTRPPPRKLNQSANICKNPADSYSFWTYDTMALTKKLTEIKEAFPNEARLIIVAEPDLEYEAVIDAMDASRSIKDASGVTKELFPEVVLSPGLL